MNDKNNIINIADKWSAGVVQDREDYIKGAEKQIGDSDVYEDLPDDSEPLINTIYKTIEKIRKIRDQKLLNISKLKNPNIAMFYLLPKIHKRLNDVPVRPVISNCGYYTEDASAFLDFHPQPLAQTVKQYIKDINDFLNKLRFFTKVT